MKRLLLLPMSCCLLFSAAQAQSWNLLGNAGTNPSIHFVGTTDNQPLRFRIVNVHAGTLGNDNTSLGKSAGAGITGFGNTALGVEALKVSTSSNYNTGLGWRSLYSNTSGYLNTASGGAALIMNTTGSHNTATGYYALGDNRTGTYNSGFGLQALGFANSGNTNTAVGAFAAGNTSSGNSNVAVGASALYWNASRSNCVAVGDSALYWTGYNFPPPTGIQGLGNTGVGSKALFNNTTGYFNTAMGYRALYATTTGNTNTALGYNAYPTTGTISNYTGIGYNVGSGSSISNSVEVGNSSVVWIGGQVGWSTYSDERIKQDIKEDVQGLAFINKLRPVTYHLNIHRQNDMTRAAVKDKGEKEWAEKYDIEKRKITGFLAQEVEQAAKACNYDFHGVTKPSTPDGLYSLSYADFVVPLVKAVQEQQSVIEKLTKKIEELEKKVEACA
ncbi:MAG: tail fiber domain-containing protein, partial [Chitinophagaceae bacterium]